MYAYIKGKLISVGEDYIIIENHGIGYQIFMASAIIEQLPEVESEMKIYTYLQVKEDAQILFGFLTARELAFFKLLIRVNGIGPKGAQAILSVLTIDELQRAIVCDDAKTISKAPGIGSKTAQRLIIELKDKIELIDIEDSDEYVETAETTDTMSGAHAKEDAIEALISLGYSATEARYAVAKVQITDGMTGEKVLKESLKNLSI